MMEIGPTCTLGPRSFKELLPGQDIWHLCPPTLPARMLSLFLAKSHCLQSSVTLQEIFVPSLAWFAVPTGADSLLSACRSARSAWWIWQGVSELTPLVQRAQD